MKKTINLNNNNFYAWFVGFCDAEANFNCIKEKRINKDGKVTSIGIKYAFHIGLHKRDRELLEYISKNLNNFGVIYDTNNNKKIESKLAIFKKEHLKWLVDNIFIDNPFLTVHQHIKFKKLKFGILNDIKNLIELEKLEKSLNFYPENKKNILSFNNLSKFFIDNWIVGFLNGEISFTYKTKKDRKYPRILLEHTDQKVVELIKNRLSIENKIVTRNRISDTVTFKKTTYMLFIESNKNLINTIYFLNETGCLSGYKFIQFEEWKKIFKFN